jgi:hypothetical protein
MNLVAFFWDDLENKSGCLVLETFATTKTRSADIVIKRNFIFRRVFVSPDNKTIKLSWGRNGKML